MLSIKELIKAILRFSKWISPFIIAPIIAYFIKPNFFEEKIAEFVDFFILYGILSCLIIIAIYLIFPYMKAYWNMFYISHYRGLWGKNHIEKKVKSYYEKSDIIKIKVTRGYNLLGKEGGLFYQLLFDEHVNNREIRVQILLHYPCLRSPHIKERSQINGQTKEDYVSDIFSVLKKIKDHSNNNNVKNNIQIKFFSHQHVNWRYYIFIKNKIQIMFFNHYNRRTPGVESEMLQIKSGGGSLLEYMDDEFNRIFDSDSVELVSNIIGSVELLNQNYCNHSECENSIKSEYKRHFR